MTDRDVAPAGRGNEDTPRGGARRYQTPTLIEYGSIAKLTQGSLSTNADGMGAGGFKKLVGAMM